jgi:Holliday junction resolvasome RuvABC endonuclease subunit
VIVVGLDLGQKLGVAISDNGTVFGGSTYELPKGKDRESMRYAQLIVVLDTIVNEYKERLQELRFVFEDVGFFKGGAASVQNAGYRAIVMGMAETAGIPFAGVGVSTLKAFAGGGGGASKETMVELLELSDHVSDEYRDRVSGWQVDDNEVDAAWLSIYGAHAIEWGERP